MKGYFAAALLIITGLLTACHSAPKKSVDVAQCDDEACRYLSTMKARVQDNFADASHYHGQRCEVTLTWGANQRYQVLRTKGDEPLCLKSWSVIASASNLPPPPVALRNGVVLDLRP